MLPRGLNAFVALMLIVCAAPLSWADAPATQFDHPYFPLTRGTTWKYAVTGKVNDKPEKSFVQTSTAGEPVTAGGQMLYSIDGDFYQLQPTGIYLFARREGDKIVPLADAQKILPAKPRTGEAWSASGKADAPYTTCLGTQTIKTQAGDFTAQALYITSGVDGVLQRETYRYFARDVGLVRETVFEKTRRPDGSFGTREVRRDLIAFTPAAAIKPSEPLKVQDPIGTDALRGELLDPNNQPIVQATLSLRRLDIPEVQQIQTDVTGRFFAAGLDPAGRYVLTTQLIGYELSELPLRSDDRKPVVAAVKLRSVAPVAGATAEADSDTPFAAAKKLAADGDHKAALAKYGEAIALDPRNAAIPAYQAMSYLALGQTQKAQQTADHALKLNDKDALVLEVAGQIKAALNQLAQARAFFDKAAQISPKTAGAMYMDLAAALARKNDNTLAGDIDSALKAAAAADPPSGEALFQLGQSYANSGKQAGTAYLKKYVELSSKLPETEQDKQKIQVAKQLIRALDVLKQTK